jgi:hypothetical protein
LAIKLNIKNLEDWNRVTTEIVSKEKGSTFITTYYNNSWKQGKILRFHFDLSHIYNPFIIAYYLLLSLICLALQAVYPEYMAERKSKPAGYWTDKQRQKEFFDRLAVKLNIKKLEDWNRVTTAQVFEEEGWHFITSHYNSSWKKGI